MLGGLFLDSILLEKYKKYAPNLRWSHGNEYKANCPFHEDSNPSFYVNSKTGLFYCFGCGVCGNLSDFLGLVGVSEKTCLDTREDLSVSKFAPERVEYLSPVLIQQLHRNLLSDTARLKYVLRERRLSFFVVKRFLLGWDTESERYAFPIQSRTGKFVNIKLHNSEKEPKSLSWRRGHGGTRLYPVSSLNRQKIVICEGEFDCLLLISHGINAITPTGGAGSWEEGWSRLFQGKVLQILYDSDIPGVRGAEDILGHLRQVAKSVEIVSYPAEFTSLGKMDVTNFVCAGGDIYKLLRITRRK